MLHVELHLFIVTDVSCAFSILIINNMYDLFSIYGTYSCEHRKAMNYESFMNKDSQTECSLKTYSA